MNTAPIEVTYINHMGDDDTVVNAARVSFSKDASTYSPEQNEKLIKYLAKHGHTSPFNHAFLTFRIKAPVFVARQLVKHKFMPWNEVSRRYVDDEPEFYTPPYWRKYSESKKQGSSSEGVEEAYFCQGMADTATVTALDAYNELLDSGVCPEQARMVLPQNMMTEWYWSGSLGAFCDMLRLRLDSHSQVETREVAHDIAAVISNLFPVSYAALLEA